MIFFLATGFLMRLSARREARHLHRDLHDLLLVDHGAVGLAQDVVEARVVGDGLLATVHAVDVARDHAGAERARSVEGDKSHDLLVLGRPHVLDRGGHARGLDLEDAGGAALAHEPEDLRVVEGDLVDVDVDAVVGLYVGERLGDDRQGAQAQEVHLEQAHVSDRVALVLGDLDAALGVDLGGDVVVDGRGRDQHGAGVDALAAVEPLDREGGVDDAAHVGVVGVGRLEVGRVLVGVLLALVQGVAERELGVVGEHLGELLALPDGEPQHARRVVDGLLGLDRGVGDDVADALGAVELADVLHDLEAALVVEVHVDVGHLGALRGEEALEHEAVLERVERGDVHRVGHDGARRRASPGADADAVPLGPAHVLLDDQEVVGEALLADDLVLVLKALAHVLAADRELAPVVAVAAGEALLALLAEALLRGLPGLEVRELGEVHVRPVELVVALLGDLERVVDDLGRPREELAHLILALEVELGARHALAVLVVQARGGADAGQDVLGGRVVAREVVVVVGGDDLDAELGAQAHDLLGERAVGEAPPCRVGQAVVLDLEVEVVAEDLLVGEGPAARLVGAAVEVHARDDAGDARRGADDALVVAAQHVERGARVVVEHVARRGLAHHFHEVDVAGLVLGQQDQVVAVLAGALLDAVVGDEVGLAAKDRLDEQGGTVRADGLEVVGLVPDAHVGGPLGVDAVMRGGVGGVGRGLLELPALLEALEVVAPLAHVLLRVVVGSARHVEVRDAEHVAVVGEGERRHAQLDRPLHHVRDARRGVEDREVGVVVQVDECHGASSRQLDEGPRRIAVT